jgi:hypothetical protein
VTQRAQVAALQQIAFLVEAKKKHLSILSNGTTNIAYNRLEFASQVCLQKMLSYFKRFPLKSIKSGRKKHKIFTLETCL